MLTLVIKINLQRKTQREVITPSVKGFRRGNFSYRFIALFIPKEIKMQKRVDLVRREIKC